MNALLLYPRFPNTFWSFRHALRFCRQRATSPPLGLLTVAAMLPQEWNRKLVDLNVRALEDEDLAWADLVLLSAMAVQRRSVSEVLTRCRAADLPVVAGGPLFTVEPESFPDVDHLVLNEAELTLPGFLADWAEGRPRRVYTNPGYADLESVPRPLWELVEQKHYLTMSLQYSRGCPFDCDFCNVTALLGHRPRTKTAPQIVGELDSLYAQGWRGGVFFVDDNLIGNKRRLKQELLPALIRWRRGKRGMTFQTEASINLADDPALLEGLVEAGFKRVFIGIETPAEESLAECSKKQNLNRDLLADVKRIQRAGLEVQGGFIVGFDSDTEAVFGQQGRFIQESGIVTAMVGMLQAPPGTRLFARLLGEKRIAQQLSGDNADGYTNIVPAMDPEVLHAGYRQLMQSLYAPENFYRRVRTFLREYNPSPIRAPLSWGNLRSLLHSSLVIGVLERSRWHYWKLMLWTLCRRPRLFPLAVAFSIQNYHFGRITTRLAPAPGHPATP